MEVRKPTERPLQSFKREVRVSWTRVSYHRGGKEVSDSESISTGEPDGFVDSQIQDGRVQVKSKMPLGFLT